MIVYCSKVPETLIPTHIDNESLKSQPFRDSKSENTNNEINTEKYLVQYATPQLHNS